MHIHPHTIIHTHTIMYSYAQTHSHAHTLSCTHSAHYHVQIGMHTLSYTHTIMYKLACTHTHYHTPTHYRAHAPANSIRTCSAVNDRVDDGVIAFLQRWIRNVKGIKTTNLQRISVNRQWIVTEKARKKEDNGRSWREPV